MLPTLRQGDFIAVSAGVENVRRGHIVVVRNPDGLEVIKRVVALGGDRHDGHPVPPGHVFVVGDNPKASTDSRETGPVPVARVVGIARAVYWPLGRVRVL
jgi:signal peptidase I